MPTNNHNLLLSRTLQYFGIILIVAAMGGGYWYWKNAKAAQQVTDNRPSFEAPLVTDLNLTAGQGIATYSRADGADRRATVTDFEGRIIPVKQNEARFEGARRVENLAQYPEAFNSWIGSGGATVTANTTNAPDGSLTADTINATGINSRIYFIKNESAGAFANRSFRFTVWIKSLTGSNTSAALYLRNQVESGFTGQTGGLTTFIATTTWQRITVLTSIGNDTTSTGMSVWIRAGDNVSTYGNVAAWGAQVEEATGATNQNPSEYVSCGVKPSAPYHGANVDCVKYFDTQNGNTVASNVVTEATGAKIASSTLKGYLAEGARTNLALRSEGFDDANWTKTASGVTANTVAAPSGSTVADKLTEDATNAAHYVTGNSISISSGLAYTVSAYAKAAENSKIGLWLTNSYFPTAGRHAWFDLSSGTVGGAQGGVTASIVSVGSGWYRCQIMVTATGTGSSGFGGIYLTQGGYGDAYAGTNGNGVHIWGAQVEQAEFASSYIPTTTAAVTRGTDLLSYPSSNADPTTGSAFAEVQSEHGRLANPNVNTAAVAVGGNSGRLIGATFAANASQVYAYDGTTAVQRASGGTFATMQRVASKWSGATYSVYKNATSASGAFDGAMASGVVYIGSYGSAASSNYGTVKNVRIWKKALSDTELQNMTSTTEGIATSAVKKTTIANTPSNTGLVGYWSFEDGSGTQAEDFSPTGTNTGTLTNGPTWVDGKIGKALAFDGTDDYVSSGDVLNMGISNFSISAWVKSTSTTSGSNNGIVYKRGTAYQYSQGYRLNMPNGVFNFHIADGTNYISLSSTTTGKNDGGWHHVVGVAERGVTLKLYIDGVLDGTAVETTIGNIDSSGTNFAIGALNTAGTSFYHPFNGLIDDVRIYNRALSSSEITGLYAQGSTGKTTVNASQNTQLTSGLVGLWSFNGSDLSGTTAYDRSGQGNNGTLTNGPSVYPGKVGQALNFDGTNDYVSLPALPSVTAPYSVSFWMKPTGGLSSGNTVVSLRGANSFPKFLLMTNNKLLAYAGGEKYRYGTRVFSSSDLNTWWHVVFVVADSAALTNWKIYLNGIDDTGTPGANTGLYYDPSTFGTVGNDIAGQYFDGALDEVRIYNRALSASEVAALYQMGR